MRFVLLASILVPVCGYKAEQGSAESEAESASAASTANPIRKVVTMLQMMMNKIEAEQKKEQALYDKFMCYCETSDGDLAKSIEEANTKIPQLESDIKASTEEKARLETELNAHMSDRDAAKTAMAKATAIKASTEEKARLETE